MHFTVVAQRPCLAAPPRDFPPNGPGPDLYEVLPYVLQ